MIRRVAGLTAVGVVLAVSGLAAQEGADDGRPELEITALDYEFRAAAAEVSAGWRTVEFHNEGEETHVLELFRIPEDGTYREVRRFYGVLDTLRADLEAGVIDSATYRKTLKEHTPSFELERAGGPGMVAPGRTTHATSRLEPGTHVMICYVRDSVGTPHLFRGMRGRLEVEPSSAGKEPPESDLEVTLAEYEMTVEGDLESGEHRNPTDNPAYFMDTFFHHPDELKVEVEDAGFESVELFAIEGISYMVDDFDANWEVEENREFLLEIVEKTEQEPSLIGASPHILCVGVKA